MPWLLKLLGTTVNAAGDSLRSSYHKWPEINAFSVDKHTSACSPSPVITWPKNTPLRRCYAWLGDTQLSSPATVWENANLASWWSILHVVTTCVVMCCDAFMEVLTWISLQVSSWCSCRCSLNAFTLCCCGRILAAIHTLINDGVAVVSAEVEVHTYDLLHGRRLVRSLACSHVTYVDLNLLGPKSKAAIMACCMTEKVWGWKCLGFWLHKHVYHVSCHDESSCWIRFGLLYKFVLQTYAISWHCMLDRMQNRFSWMGVTVFMSAGERHTILEWSCTLCAVSCCSASFTFGCPEPYLW